MLVLTRKEQQKIHIGDDIIITVVEIHGKQIRLGIDAPTEISIFRGEIYDRIQEEKRSVDATDKTEK